METVVDEYAAWWESLWARQRKELGEEPCPYPCRGRPDAFPMRLCRAAGECGCTKGAPPDDANG